MLWRPPFFCRSKRNWAGRRDYQMGTNTANSSHEARVAKLPTKVRERLKGRPTEGQGVHPWLFNTPRSLHKHFSEEEIVDILCPNLIFHRPGPEIPDAVLPPTNHAPPLTV